jgi:hypothetical protein
MSIAAWPSMDPATPWPACWRAAAMSRLRTKIRNARAISTIMIGPPVNSARVNCQPRAAGDGLLVPVAAREPGTQVPVPLRAGRGCGRGGKERS